MTRWSVEASQKRSSQKTREHSEVRRHSDEKAGGESDERAVAEVVKVAGRDGAAANESEDDASEDGEEKPRPGRAALLGTSASRN
jgi:hypothetical protein